MDEPFAALDEQTRLLLGDKVLQIQQELQQTTLIITHNITEAVQLADRILVMTYRPGRVKRIVDIDLPRPRSSEIVSSDAFGRYVAQIWSDLREEASRGMRDEETRRKAWRAPHREQCSRRVEVGSLTRLPGAARLRARLILFLVAVEFLIRVGVINRFIVPTAVADRGRVRARHPRGGHRRALSAHLHRGFHRRRHDHRDRRPRRRAALSVRSLWRRATETWIAAIASAPTVLMYPLFLVIFGRSAWTIIMMGFVAGLPPVILKTIEGLVTTRARADQCRAQLQAQRAAAVLEDPVPGRAADHLRRRAARA